MSDFARLRVAEEGGAVTLTAMQQRPEVRTVFKVRALSVSRLVVDDFTRRVYEGYDARVAKTVGTWQATEVVSIANNNSTGAALVELRTSHEGDVRVLVSAHAYRHANGANVYVFNATIETISCNPGLLRLLCPVNRIAIDWQPQTATDRIFGLGERFNTNGRGDASITKDAYCYTEDGGWDLVPDVRRRWPKRTATYMPAPFIISDEGYVLYANTHARTLWSPEQHAVYAEDTALPLVLFDGNGNTRNARDAYVGAYAGAPLIPPPFQLGVWEGFQS